MLIMKIEYKLYSFTEIYKTEQKDYFRSVKYFSLIRKDMCMCI